MQVPKVVCILLFNVLLTIACGPSTSRPGDGPALVLMRDGVHLATDLYLPRGDGRMVERYCHVTDEELHRAVRMAATHATDTNTVTADSNEPPAASSQSA